MIDTEVKGEPASIDSAAKWLRGTLALGVDGAANALASAKRTAGADWGGDAGPAFSAQMGKGANATDDLVTKVKSSATSCEAFANKMRNAQDRMATIRETASSADLTVRGFVIEDPGAGPGHPGPAPTDAPPVQVDHYNTSVLLYNAHQERILAYNAAAKDAQEVHDEFAKACTALEDEYKGASTAEWLLSSADVAGTAVVAALGAKHLSVLQRNARHFAGEADKWRTRMAGTDYSGQGGRDVLDRDARSLRDAQNKATAAAGDADDARLRPKFGTAGKVLGPAGVGLGIFADVQSGESTTQAVVSNVGGAAVGAGVGTLAGVGTAALAGAAFGSAVPVVGTVIGAAVGAGVGIVASGAIDSLFENGPDVGQAWDEGTEALTDTLGAIGDAGGSVADTVGGWFD